MAKKKKKESADPKEYVSPSKKRTNRFALPVFLFSFTVVLISFVAVLFPALIASSGTPQIPGVSYVGPEPFEPGPWAVPVILSNVIVFSLLALYLKERLPQTLTNRLRGLFEFEVSRRVTFVVVLVLLAIYIIPTTQELQETESWEDYKGVKQRLETWPAGAQPTEPNVRYFFLKSSEVVFGNDRVVPFLASICLLILVYYTTLQITQKRFAGIASLVIVLQSHVFLAYDTTVSYTNFWVLFYILSLYLIYKRVWPASPVSYLASISSKALTAMFLPMSAYFVLRSDISRRSKAIIAGAMTAIVLAGAAAFASSQAGGEAGAEEFSSKEFWLGFTSFANQLRFDGLVLLFMIPLIVGLFIASRYQIRHAESIMVLLSGMLLIAPILTGFTNQTNQPYRFVPLVVFFAMGVGVLLSKRAKTEA